jgi:hypothetical protein
VSTNILQEQYARVQIQDSQGIWRDRGIVRNDSQYILRAMQSAQSQYPKTRVRTVDFSGRVIDILTK